MRMLIGAKPIENMERQRDSIMRLRDLFDPTQQDEPWNNHGNARNSVVGIECEWVLVPENITVTLNLEGNRKNAIICRIPLGTVNANVLGLLATDRQGHRLLCRQRIPNSNRQSAESGLSFFTNGLGPELDEFRLASRPSSPERVFYVLARLDDSSEPVLPGLRAILQAELGLESSPGAQISTKTPYDQPMTI